jgi:hypothetical protein
MQLPLTLGGLSLTFAESIGDIAYAASATDCIPALRTAAQLFSIPFSFELIPELAAAFFHSFLF